MTTKPTIDGVSRELIQRVADHCKFWIDHPYLEAISDIEPELRALLDVSSVEKGTESVSRFWCHEASNIRCVRESDYDAAQATIAQLEAKVAELERGQGEPVGHVYTMEALVPSGEVRHHTKLYRPLPSGTKLYTSPPAPVVAPEKYDDVLLPFMSLMRAELHANAHKVDRPGWLQMDRKTAILEVFYHLGKLHQAVHRGDEPAIKEYAADVANMCMMLLDVCACLDATAALNANNRVIAIDPGKPGSDMTAKATYSVEDGKVTIHSIEHTEVKP